VSSSRRGTGLTAITLSLRDQSIERFQNTIEANPYFCSLNPLTNPEICGILFVGAFPRIGSKEQFSRPSMGFFKD
jgi:hypothetical protein